MRISDWSSDVCSSDLLTRRPQFLAVADARRKAVLPGLILQIRAHDERQQPREDEPAVRVGFTASRKIGNAVARNRAQIGRASCRERVCQYVYISVVAVSLKIKHRSRNAAHISQ